MRQLVPFATLFKIAIIGYLENRFVKHKNILLMQACPSCTPLLGTDETKGMITHLSHRSLEVSQSSQELGTDEIKLKICVWVKLIKTRKI